MVTLSPLTMPMSSIVLFTYKVVFVMYCGGYSTDNTALCRFSLYENINSKIDSHRLLVEIHENSGERATF